MGIPAHIWFSLLRKNNNNQKPDINGREIQPNDILRLQIRGNILFEPLVF